MNILIQRRGFKDVIFYDLPLNLNDKTFDDTCYCYMACKLLKYCLKLKAIARCLMLKYLRVTELPMSNSCNEVHHSSKPGYWCYYSNIGLARRLRNHVHHTPQYKCVSVASVSSTGFLKLLFSVILLLSRLEYKSHCVLPEKCENMFVLQDMHFI